MLRSMRALLLITDLGFIAYWLLTLGHVLPHAWLFQGYDDAVIASWNLSFLPLDLAVSATGLAALALGRTCPHAARQFLTISLAATAISGLQAIVFWALRHNYDLAWWLPNLFLLLWPLPYLAWLTWNAHRPPARAAAHALGCQNGSS